MKLLFFALGLVLVTNFIFSQEDYKKWKENEEKKFQNFIDEQDKEFSDFLKKNWTPFQTNVEKKPPEPPKPVTPPIIKIRDEKEEPRTEEEIKIDKIEIEERIKSNLPPQKIEPQEKYDKNFLLAQISFYGAEADIAYPEEIFIRTDEKLTNDKIGEYWEKMSRTNFKPTLEEFLNYRKALNLNDWAYTEFLFRTASKIFNERNDQNLFTWYFLNKSGYKARIGLAGKSAFLLIPFKTNIFGVSFIRSKNDPVNYYVIDFNAFGQPVGEPIYTYDKDFPDAVITPDMRVKSSPNFGSNIESKTISFAYAEKNYSVELLYDKNAISFYKNYPYVDLGVYFDAKPSDAFRISVANSLKKLIENKSEIEAVDILLRFVQLGFGYKIDQDQFGREKPLFAEETIYYDFSDCEDRSALFAYLVENLVGLEVVGLDYPGHVATAVKFNQQFDGDSIKYKGEKYLICDPTYMYASIGMQMPEVKNDEPKVITRFK